ncbi:MAG: outer membrane protein assembly factor BamD [Candidatus Sulfobium sp.]
MEKLQLLSLVFLVSLLFSCSGKTAVKPTEVGFNAQRSFAKANKLIEDKDYKEARRILTEIKNRDLSGKFAPLAQLKIADSYARDDEPELAAAEYRKFIEMFPDHRLASYAQYQIAMIYFDQIEGPERGYSGAAQALAEFEKLKRDYPRNPYREIVNLRIQKCRNTIADYEFLVGKFYMDKDSYNAAIGRFEGLVGKYPKYRNMDRVLLDLGICYMEKGRNDKASDYFTRLLDGYPNSPLAAKARKKLSSLEIGKK